MSLKSFFKELIKSRVGIDIWILGVSTFGQALYWWQFLILCNKLLSNELWGFWDQFILKSMIEVMNELHTCLKFVNLTLH